MQSLIVYPEGSDSITIPVANGFVSRVVSSIANSDQMGCIPDAERVAKILNALYERNDPLIKE